ncbi:MAG: hypothetical protein PHZ09_03815 [Eubacteriales bacterium]|nr:hypothetical protein [Eubacteriales bacterium]
MFVKITNAKEYTYINIVQSYRDETGVTRHKTLHKLGRLDQLREDKSFAECVKKLCGLLDIPLAGDEE